MKKAKESTSKTLSNAVVEGMLEKKAKNVVLMDLREVPNAITDFFVICSGTSDTQLDAIAKSIEETVYKTFNEDPWHNEGQSNREWILLDYSNVVAHIFKEDKRAFFDIESLWGDARITQYDESMAPIETFTN